MTPPGAVERADAVDGRNARRDRNRARVLDAALALFRDGVLEPSAADVAERAGVSERSVWRYFDDREALMRAAVDHHLAQTLPLFAVPGAGQGPLAERVERYVEHRLAVYRALAPTARVAVLRAPTNAMVREPLDISRRRLHDTFDEVFAPELRALPAADRRAVTAAADTLVQFEALEHLFHHLRLTRPQVRRTLIHTLAVLLTG